MKQKYHSAFLDMSVRFGQTSEAKRLRVGALLVRDGKILSQGTNGQPPKWHTEVCEDDEGNTLPTVRHAEIACLEKLWNSTETADGATMYISHSPCLNCSIKMFTAGVSSVYYKEEYRCDEGVKFLQKNGVKVEKFEDIENIYQHSDCNSVAADNHKQNCC